MHTAAEAPARETCIAACVLTSTSVATMVQIYLRYTFMRAVIRSPRLNATP